MKTKLNKLMDICIKIFLTYIFAIIAIVANNIIDPRIIIWFLFLTIFTTFILIYIGRDEINFKK